tara:strand:+ start:183 stop:545 length:363 start_codon:yes stop_codon:yes gene_type:complete
MEDQIKAAKSAMTSSGQLCKGLGILGSIVAVFVVIFGFSKAMEQEKNGSPAGGTAAVFLAYGVGILGVSASYAALGSISINQKRTSELMALMVESQNSASELPISTTTEYSDLLEDSENK